MMPQVRGVYTLGNEASRADVRARRVTTVPTEDPNDPDWGEPFTTRGGDPGSMTVPVTFWGSLRNNISIRKCFGVCS